MFLCNITGISQGYAAQNCGATNDRPTVTENQDKDDIIED